MYYVLCIIMYYSMPSPTTPCAIQCRVRLRPVLVNAKSDSALC